MTLTKNQLAKKLNVAPRTLDRWRLAGLPGHEVDGRPSFDLSEVLAWIERHGVGVTKIPMERLRAEDAAAAGSTPADDDTEDSAHEFHETILVALAVLLRLDRDAQEALCIPTKVTVSIPVFTAFVERIDPLLRADPDFYRRLALWNAETRARLAGILRDAETEAKMLADCEGGQAVYP